MVHFGDGSQATAFIIAKLIASHNPLFLINSSEPFYSQPLQIILNLAAQYHMHGTVEVKGHAQQSAFFYSN